MKKAISRRRVMELTAAFAASSVIAHNVQAQAYPNRIIRLIAPFPAGGGTDSAARIIAAGLSDLLRLAGVRSDAVDVVFTGADHGVERGVEQDYQRGMSVVDAIEYAPALERGVSRHAQVDRHQSGRELSSSTANLCATPGVTLACSW